MMSVLAVGRIAHAWSYVWPAYIITWLGLGLYSLSLVVRLRRGKDRS